MRALAIGLVLLAACTSRRGGGDDGDGDGDGDGDADVDDPRCDGDADGHASLECGGDDCDDAVSSVHPGAPDALWQVERLGQGGEWVSFVQAADGARHLVVGQGLYGIQYVTDASGAWTAEVIDGQRYQGHQTGLALDPSGAAHVVWVPEATRELRYATNASGAWVTETIDASRNIDYPCLALDSAGAMHVAYTDQDTYDVLAATRVDGRWQTEPIGARGTDLAMAIGPDDAVHVVIANPGGGGGAPTHASDASGAWILEGTGAGYPNGAGADPAIAIDEAGVVHVAWYVPSQGGLLRLSSNPAGVFVEESVTTLGTYGGTPSIAFDAAGTMHLAATQGDDWSDASILHAVEDAGTWVAQQVAGGRGAMAHVAPDGQAAILFATRDFDLAIVRHAFEDDVDDDCDGMADRHSSLPPSTATTALTDDEAAALCTWGLDLQGGPSSRHVCGDATVTVDAVEECVATRGMCPTVEAFEDCVLAVASDVCALPSGLPPACEPCTAGLDPARTLAELSAPEWEQWCTWSISTQGGEGRITTCPDGHVEVGTIDSCTSASFLFQGCPLTIGEATACTMAMAEDACTGIDAPACAAMLSCMLDG